MTARLLDCGPHAALFELTDLDAVDAFRAHVHQAVDAGTLAGVEDIVPAARTVLVSCVDAASREAAVRLARDWVPAATTRPAATEHRIEVTYDGPDLAAVAEQAGLGVDAVVSLHSQAEYRVAFMGFAPGFGYLTGLPAELHLPRRADPRTKVPPRSVAIAGEFSAVYPRTSPGGWNLIGRAVDPVWFDDRERPNLLAPGDIVRFEVAS